MFYDVDVAQTDVRFFGGGAQDNGTIVTTDGRPDTFFEMDGGDGGWIVIDPNEADHVYTSSQFGAMILEWQTYFDTQPMWKEIVTYDGPWVEKGFIRVSEKPGIGVDINEEAMRKYALPGVPFFA